VHLPGGLDEAACSGLPDPHLIGEDLAVIKAAYLVLHDQVCVYPAKTDDSTIGNGQPAGDGYRPAAVLQRAVDLQVPGEDPLAPDRPPGRYHRRSACLQHHAVRDEAAKVGLGIEPSRADEQGVGLPDEGRRGGVADRAGPAVQ